MLKRLVFLQIPKCGGTSLHSALESHFDGAEQCPERLRFLDRTSDEQIGRFRFYSGHYYFDQIARIPAPKTVITMLREPRGRLLSLYYFFRAHTWAQIEYCERIRVDSPRLAKLMDLRSYLCSMDFIPRLYADNAIARHLIGFQYMAPNGDFLISHDEAFRVAVRNLATMTAFGILEQYDRTRSHLESAVGFTLPEELPHDNTWDSCVKSGLLEPIERENRFDEATEAAIARSIAVDQRIYDWALNHKSAD